MKYNDLKRRKAYLEPRPRLLLVCEGRVTEKGYFEALRRETQNRLLIVEVVGDGESPKTVVEHATDLKRRAEKAANAAQDVYLKYDEVWCVFDRDGHARIPEAMQQARDNNLNVAFSNPCFELWILLHFRDQRAQLTCAQAAALVKGHIPRYEKAIPYETVAPHYLEAVGRAERLAKWQAEQGRVGGNPFTDVHVLTRRIFELGRRAQLRA
jgi:hypothetical protein